MRAQRLHVVLVVHNDPDVRASARAALERSGYPVVTAATQAEAVRLVPLVQVSAVVAAGTLAGRRLIQALRKAPGLGSLPAVLLRPQVAQRLMVLTRAELLPDNRLDFDLTEAINRLLESAEPAAFR